MSDLNIANLTVAFLKVDLRRIYTALAGKIQLKPFVVQAIPLNNSNEMFALMLERKSIRSVMRDSVSATESLNRQLVA